MTGAMLASERRKRMLGHVRERGTALIADIERRLGISRMTVYRDLDALVDEGLVRRVHGGVMAVDTEKAPAPSDPRARPLKDRLSVAAPAKRAIARHLVTLLAGPRTAVFDNSSTVFFLAECLEALGAAGDFFMVTGSVSLYLEAQRRAPANVRVALHGGEPHIRTGSLVGPMATGSLREMRFDFSVISCLGVLQDEQRVFVSNPEEGEIKRLYLERSRRRILAVDQSKFGLSGPYEMTDLSDFDYVVTEAGITTQLRPASEVASSGSSKKSRSSR